MQISGMELLALRLFMVAFLFVVFLIVELVWRFIWPKRRISIYFFMIPFIFLFSMGLLGSMMFFAIFAIVRSFKNCKLFTIDNIIIENNDKTVEINDSNNKTITHHNSQIINKNNNYIQYTILISIVVFLIIFAALKYEKFNINEKGKDSIEISNDKNTNIQSTLVDSENFKNWFFTTIREGSNLRYILLSSLDPENCIFLELYEGDIFSFDYDICFGIKKTNINNYISNKISIYIDGIYKFDKEIEIIHENDMIILKINDVDKYQLIDLFKKGKNLKISINNEKKIKFFNFSLIGFTKAYNTAYGKLRK